MDRLKGQVRTRIAPSPTGDPHVGTLYMALFNWIFARHHGGQFILRVEDTDRKRSDPKYYESLLAALTWAGVSWDEGPDVGGPFGPYQQSERSSIYRKYADDLLDQGGAYRCFATEQELRMMREVGGQAGRRIGYDRRYRNLTAAEEQERMQRGESYTIRLKVPLTGECCYRDLIKGEVKVPWSDVDDQVLIKSDGFPTYHLANVVDDHLMQISHVIRGDEWMSSTPKHVLLYDLFGWERPAFVHLPLLLGQDGKKLSKRKSPTSILFYRDSGYLPEAFVNFMTLISYSMPEGKECYTLDEIVSSFSLDRMGVSGACFDERKLDWMNQQYLIGALTDEELWQRIAKWGFSTEKMEQLMPLVHTRIKTFGEFIELCGFLFTNRVELSEDQLCPRQLSPQESRSILQVMILKMDLNDRWDRKSFEEASYFTADLLGHHHKKEVMRILFAAITGKQQGPPLFSSFGLLGKYRGRVRLLRAIEYLGGVSKKRMVELQKLVQERSERS